jgi:uncharacterized RDD family membrane protein YckC
MEQAQTHQYAGFWIRLLAAFLDWVIFGIPLFILDVVIFMLVTGSGIGEYFEYLSGENYHGTYEIIFTIIQIILSIWYYVYLVSSKMQATPGKAILGLKIINKHGEKLSFWHAFGRNLAYIPSALLLGIGYLMIAWTKKKQGLHDKIANTYVVYK